MTQMSKRRLRRGRGACCAELPTVLEARFFRALCDPGRVRLLARLARLGKPCTVTQISACCPTDLSVVSRHLALMREAGLLQAEKRGREVYYSICYREMVGTLRAMADAIEACCPGERQRGTKA